VENPDQQKEEKDSDADSSSRYAPLGGPPHSSG
jgi:hypothetical protein